jgi:hypothetical protein
VVLFPGKPEATNRQQDASTCQDPNVGNKQVADPNEESFSIEVAVHDTTKVEVMDV